eukprot:8476155-Pyramimonas_sp.AAC.1
MSSRLSAASFASSATTGVILMLLLLLCGEVHRVSTVPIDDTAQRHACATTHATGHDAYRHHQQ